MAVISTVAKLRLQTANRHRRVARTVTVSGLYRSCWPGTALLGAQLLAPYTRPKRSMQIHGSFTLALSRTERAEAVTPRRTVTTPPTVKKLDGATTVTTRDGDGSAIDDCQGLSCQGVSWHGLVLDHSWVRGGGTSGRWCSEIRMMASRS